MGSHDQLTDLTGMLCVDEEEDRIFRPGDADDRCEKAESPLRHRTSTKTGLSHLLCVMCDALILIKLLFFSHLGWDFFFPPPRPQQLCPSAAFHCSFIPHFISSSPCFWVHS